MGTHRVRLGPFKGRFQDWAEGGGERVVHCPSCARLSGIDRWSWGDDYYACGHLGFTFWGWAELMSDFTREIGRKPGGHRAVLLAGKL
ncbi:hypothetical protein ACFV1C_06020 [Streptomyces sp. NPDC059605]|uniref:hypothetical protein n=1 Tax=unclassified Streptomyces TaxID=2593676 RepID=UPI0036B0FF8C